MNKSEIIKAIMNEMREFTEMPPLDQIRGILLCLIPDDLPQPWTWERFVNRVAELDGDGISSKAGFAAISDAYQEMLADSPKPTPTPLCGTTAAEVAELLNDKDAEIAELRKQVRQLSAETERLQSELFQIRTNPAEHIHDIYCSNPRGPRSECAVCRKSKNPVDKLLDEIKEMESENQKLRDQLAATTTRAEHAEAEKLTDDDIWDAVVFDIFGEPPSGNFNREDFIKHVRQVIAQPRPTIKQAKELTDEEIDSAVKTTFGIAFVGTNTAKQLRKFVRWAVSQSQPAVCGPTAGRIANTFLGRLPVPVENNDIEAIYGTLHGVLRQALAGIRPVVEVEKPLRDEIERLSTVIERLEIESRKRADRHFSLDKHARSLEKSVSLAHKEIEQLEDDIRQTRKSHAKICTGIKKALRWNHYPVGHEPVADQLVDGVKAVADLGRQLTENKQLLDAEIERLKKLEGKDDHPEHKCDKCGGRNIESWHADNDTWNRVVGNEGSILCPICFDEMNTKLEGDYSVWRLSRDDEPELTDKLRVEIAHTHDKLNAAYKEIERLKEKCMAEGHEAACQKARADHLADKAEKRKAHIVALQDCLSKRNAQIQELKAAFEEANIEAYRNGDSRPLQDVIDELRQRVAEKIVAEQADVNAEVAAEHQNIWPKWFERNDGDESDSHFYRWDSTDSYAVFYRDGKPYPKRGWVYSNMLNGYACITFTRLPCEPQAVREYREKHEVRYWKSIVGGQWRLTNDQLNFRSAIGREWHASTCSLDEIEKSITITEITAEEAAAIVGKKEGT